MWKRGVDQGRMAALSISLSRRHLHITPGGELSLVLVPCLVHGDDPISYAATETTAVRRNYEKRSTNRCRGSAALFSILASLFNAERAARCLHGGCLSRVSCVWLAGCALRAC